MKYSTLCHCNIVITFYFTFMQESHFIVDIDVLIESCHITRINYKALKIKIILF